MLRYGLVVLAVLTVASHAVAISVAPDPRSVSFAQLKTHPREYDGKEVILYGFLVFKFEESSLYESRLDAELMDPAHELPLFGKGGLEHLNGKLVRVHAVFRAPPDHPGGYLDSVKEIVEAVKSRTFP
jgi:hypothetical protein